VLQVHDFLVAHGRQIAPVDEVQRPLLHTLQLLGARLVERVPSRQLKRPNGLDQRQVGHNFEPWAACTLTGPQAGKMSNCADFARTVSV